MNRINKFTFVSLSKLERERNYKRMFKLCKRELRREVLLTMEGLKYY